MKIMKMHKPSGRIEFQCETVRDYHNIYLICDTLQLADLFENFRDICQDHYELDPAWYYTAPGLSWDACLKITGAKLELITDYDILLMIEDGTRGGVPIIQIDMLKLIILI